LSTELDYDPFAEGTFKGYQIAKDKKKQNKK
jgi:hypothetical protein